ncbi:hypothetical protein C3747_82g74 [Trypanosoma cruzi]|uniref:Uncharacterized protein n=1 Tax=Trypanosoma cruzi TaxID=5693 RepID=A0A2V2WL76_TRYCR|nr:hypothetical protein C3747_82g74 [Trypanosoma cruzi]
MLPSAREVEELVVATVRGGNWARAVMLFAGALKLPCVPTSRTYAEVVAAVATRSTWEVTVQVLDRLQTSPLSARAVYHTAADAILARNDGVIPEKLLALILSARRRRVTLDARHYMQCSRLLLDSGDWHGALLVCSHERLIQHAPFLAQPTMLAAAAGHHWVAGLKIMSSLLALGNIPSAAITESFIRCFSPTSPWWRALAVASVLTCRDAPEVKQRAHDLREEVTHHAKSPEINAKEGRRRVLLRVANGGPMPEDLTMGEAKEVLAMMKDRQWERALDLFCAFPALLELTPRPPALLLPMTVLGNVARRLRYWEALWEAVSRTLIAVPMDNVLSAASLFLAYMRIEEQGADAQEKAKEVARARDAVIAFINNRRMHEGRALEPAALHSFVHSTCTRGCWEDALSFTERPAVVFAELVERSNWQAAIAIYGTMLPSAQERAGPQLEHLFISMGLWVPALRYAQSYLPDDTFALRSLAIPLCAALGQWRRALHMLFCHVPLPTAAEALLKRYCFLRHTEETIYEASESGDWMKALQAWNAVRQIPYDRTILARRGGEGNTDEDAHPCISPHALKCTAKLLLEHQRYDDCCLVLSSHKPTASDPLLLRFLQMFYYIRLSPLSYGRVLQKYREAHAPYRVVLDGYAVLALSVSGNHSGAFWILRSLSSTREAELENAIARGFDEVPHVKQMFSSLLLKGAKSSQVVDLEAVMGMLIPCVKSFEEVNLFNEPLTAFWGSDSDALRECALSISTKLAQHMMAKELPVPWAVLRIVAGGLDRPAECSTAHLLYEAVRQQGVLSTTEEVERVGDEKSGFWRPSKEERDIFFRRCAEAFIRMGHWSRALEAMQDCEATDEMTLFRIAVLLKEEKDCRMRMAHRVILEATSNDDKNTSDDNSSLVLGRQAEEALFALTQLHAWKAALVVFNGVVAGGRHWSRGSGGSLSSGVVNALLSSVASFGHWELALQILKTVQKEFSNVIAFIDKGITDVLRSVRRHGGAIMCSKLLLFFVEEMGGVPTPLQYEVLLGSVLGSQLTAVERDVCAENLKRLSQSLNEKQVIDLILAITISGRSWEEEDTDGAIVLPFAGMERRQRMALSNHPRPTCWIPVERPPLSVDEFHQLCHLAPRIVLATSRGLETLSQEAFSGRFRPFELKLLLQHYRMEVLALVRDTGDGALALDTQLVEYCRESKLLHILLLPHERVWRRTLPPVGTESAAAFIERLTSAVFHGFASPQTVAAVWEMCHPFVTQLAEKRWPWLCEYELLRAVRRRGGKPPTSLLTRPDASRVEITSYWATYGRAIWPELFFSGPELCQLAVYVPLVEPLLGNEQELSELLAGIQLAHFSVEAIPQGEELLRQPRSVRAIHAVFKLAFKTLKRLHTQLDTDARGGRFYYHHHPDASLWKRYSSEANMKERLPRWALALRIIHHYRRFTANTLPPRMLAALFSACASDAAEATCVPKKKAKQPKKLSFWELAIQCAQTVEPKFTPTLWYHAMQLACLQMSFKGAYARASEEYCLEDMHDTSLQATSRVLLSHAKKRDGKIPFAVSLLLIDQMKELMDEVHSREYAQDESTQGEDALTLWALLQNHGCLERMEPPHAVLLRRLFLEGNPSSEAL